MASALNVVERYYEAFDNKRGGWKDLVTDDVSMVGPLQRATGREEFVALTDGFLRFHRKTRLLDRIAGGDQVCSLYEFDLDTPAGQPLTCAVTEWARVSGDRICEFRLFYDPRAFAQAFGMAG